MAAERSQGFCHFFSTKGIGLHSNHKNIYCSAIDFKRRSAQPAKALSSENSSRDGFISADLGTTHQRESWQVFKHVLTPFCLHSQEHPQLHLPMLSINVLQHSQNV